MTERKKPRTWGSVYYASLAKGHDHGYAAFRANEWERRQKKSKERPND